MTAGAAFRRAIAIRGRPGRVDADLEDDFHRFGVTLHHDDVRLIAVEGRAMRYPWVTCLEAPAALNALCGMTLGAHPTALFRHADPRAHCTHLFELAALAMPQAMRDEGVRLYEAEVDDPVGGAGAARLFRDGVLALEWTLAGDVITAPPVFAGRDIASFRTTALADQPPDLAEYLMILRRVTQTAKGRRLDVDAFATAADMGRSAQCYSLQPAAAARANRVKGSIRNWPDRAALLRSVHHRSEL